jgi:peptidoglycan/LPS O-acetylase OafA/YrhL
MSNAPYKFGFADFLRGPAALCVLIAHIVGNVMDWPPSMFFLGQLGVAVFFLVSGFVISISLTKYNIQGFLLARILRIYPTYAVALTVTLVCAWILGDQPLGTDVTRYIANYLIASDLLGTDTYDKIVWTLEIELHFYLLCILLAPLIRDFRLIVLMMPAALFIAGRAGWAIGFPPAREAPCLLFMFGGVAAFYFVNGKISATMLIAYCAGCYLLSSVGQPSAKAPLSYAAATLIFLGALFWGDRLRGTFFSEISYSLYAINYGISLFAEKEMLRSGFPTVVAMLAGLVAALGAAVVLHFCVEVPTHQLGRRLGRRLSSRPVIAFRKRLTEQTDYR